MRIRSWGSRGSIAVSGKEYLKYGGDTTCIELESDGGDTVIIDAGTGIRKLGNMLLKEKRYENINLLLTHAHWDHLSGFPFFKPLYKEDCTIRVWGPRLTQDSVKSIITKTMSPPYFPIEIGDTHAEVEFSGIESSILNIGTFNIKTIPLSHTNQGAGYRFEENGHSFVFLTDNELTLVHDGGKKYEDYVKFCEGADLLFHDAEYTPEDYKHTKGWGHTVYTDTVRLGLDAGVKTLGLIQHNQDRNDDGVDDILKESKKIVKDKSSKMEVIAVSSETEIKF